MLHKLLLVVRGWLVIVTATMAAACSFQSASADEEGSVANGRLDLTVNKRGAGNLTMIDIRNNAQEPIVVQRIILNNLENDQDCSIKVFATLKQDDSVTKSAGSCGNVIDLKIETDAGNLEENFDSKKGTVAFTSHGDHFDLQNTSTGAIVVKRLILNGLEGDSNCDIKIFESLEPDDYARIFDGYACGDVKSYKLLFDYQGSEKTLAENLVRPLKITKKGSDSSGLFGK